jgi:hypothetical protein
MPVEQRLAEIRSRYGPGDLVSRAIARSAPDLTGAVMRVSRRLAHSTPMPRAALPVRTRVLIGAI